MRGRPITRERLSGVRLSGRSIPGRDWTSARMRGRPIPRERVYILNSDYSDVITFRAGINAASQEVFSTCVPFGCDCIVLL